VSRIAIAVGAAACLLALPSAASAATAMTSQPLYVNMRDSGPYRLGRYVDGQPSPAGAIATSRCGLWSPSVVTVGATTYLYAAECSGSYRGTGWYTIVRYTSRDGGVRFTGKTVIRTFARDQIRMPMVVYDRARFHLWYTQDRGGRLAQGLMYSASVDGVHFTVPQRKFTAGTLNAISVSTVFRADQSWWMLLEGYSSDLETAQPHLLSFGSSYQPQYEYRSPIDTDKPAPKIDASMVCRDGERWHGLFVAYGGPQGRELTMAFDADELTGPWRLVSDPDLPVLSLENDGSIMHSVENPTRASSTAALGTCDSLEREIREGHRP
jgi:hypothetical protein